MLLFIVIMTIWQHRVNLQQRPTLVTRALGQWCVYGHANVYQSSQSCCLGRSGRVGVVDLEARARKNWLVYCVIDNLILIQVKFVHPSAPLLHFLFGNTVLYADWPNIQTLDHSYNCYSHDIYIPLLIHFDFKAAILQNNNYTNIMVNEYIIWFHRQDG